MVEFIINKPDKDKPDRWTISNDDLRLTLKDIMSLRTDFNYIDKVEITFNSNYNKKKTNSKNYAFPDKYI